MAGTLRRPTTWLLIGAIAAVVAASSITSADPDLWGHLRFGLDLVHAVFKDTAIAAPMVVVWLLLGALPKLGRRLPPIIGALLAGAVAVIVFGRSDTTAPMQLELIRPVLQTPASTTAVRSTRPHRTRGRRTPARRTAGLTRG